MFRKKQKPECGKCIYYVQRTDYHGECRFNSPVLIIKTPDSKEWPATESKWPTTAPWEWCGQFKNKM